MKNSFTASVVMTIFMVVVLMSLLALDVVEGIMESRVRLIDSNSQLNRFLFRGNTPIEHGNFAIGKLRDLVREVGKNNNVQVPDEFYLIDVSFLNMFEEDLKDETEYFKANPHIGELVHWTIIGNPINGTDLPEWLRKDLAIYEKKWDREDKLIDRVDQLYNWIHTQDSIHNLNQDAQSAKALVFYIHCEAGMDRYVEFHII
ncbi:predicted protein [Naegleria gruberi]|uniref:Predicted protein n=1 Tax=Naegleria gruberi TaxID=5762 RepID=D2VV20_NAEGR|nr:uncharacterized protein NAEGRDRAFT_72862 [Naegleria gruberi]EFC39365.1 predicted protein [Naegleria gruberi]|eukprot:XP_002672109.1 predicted protein [Naegleria gruberi strain NEG-M]